MSQVVLGLSVVHRAGRHPCWSTGGYTGPVRVGILDGWGTTPGAPTDRAEPRSPHDSGAGPGSPCQGLEWVVMWVGGDPFA